MLILQRNSGQSIWIGEDIQIIMLSHSNGSTRIGINAPAELVILRDELKPKGKSKEQVRPS